MLEYSTSNVQVELSTDGWVMIFGTLNIAGYSKLSNFIENDKSKFIKLTNARRGSRFYKFIMINKDKIIGIYESN